MSSLMLTNRKSYDASSIWSCPIPDVEVTPPYTCKSIVPSEISSPVVPRKTSAMAASHYNPWSTVVATMECADAVASEREDEGEFLRQWWCVESGAYIIVNC